MPAPLALAAFLALPALFTDATAKLGSPQPCGPGAEEGCYSNYVVLADLDGDGDLDAVFASGGGYYEPGDAAPMAVYAAFDFGAVPRKITHCASASSPSGEPSRS